MVYFQQFEAEAPGNPLLPFWDRRFERTWSSVFTISLGGLALLTPPLTSVCSGEAGSFWRLRLSNLQWLWEGFHQNQRKIQTRWEGISADQSPGSTLQTLCSLSVRAELSNRLLVCKQSRDDKWTSLQIHQSFRPQLGNWKGTRKWDSSCSGLLITQINLKQWEKPEPAAFHQENKRLCVLSPCTRDSSWIHQFRLSERSLILCCQKEAGEIWVSKSWDLKSITMRQCLSETSDPSRKLSGLSTNLRLFD